MYLKKNSSPKTNECVSDALPNQLVISAKKMSVFISQLKDCVNKSTICRLPPLSVRPFFTTLFLGAFSATLRLLFPIYSVQWVCC